MSTASAVVRRGAPIAGIAVVVALTIQTIADRGFDLGAVVWPLAIAALVANCLGNLATAALMLSRYRRHGSTVERRTLLRAYFLGQLAKYVPGKVAGLWYQAATLAQPGAAHVALTSSIDVMLIGMVANTSAGVALLLASVQPAAAVVAIVLGALGCLAVGSLRWTAGLAARVMRSLSLHVPEADFTAPGTRRAILAYYAANLVLTVPSVALLLVAAMGVEPASALVLTGVSLLAWVAGAAAFVFPAGVGVRETVFIGVGHLAGTPLDLDGLVAAAVWLRLFQIVQDVVCAAAFVLLDRRRATAPTHVGKNPT